MHGRYICFKPRPTMVSQKSIKKNTTTMRIICKHKIQHKMHLTKKLVSLYISFIHVLFYKLFFSQAYILHLLFLVSTQNEDIYFILLFKHTLRTSIRQIFLEPGVKFSSYTIRNSLKYSTISVL